MAQTGDGYLDDRQFLLSVARPCREQRWLAAWLVGALLAALLVAMPFARLPLADGGWLLPAYAIAVLLTDLITASLLFAIFSVQRSPALLLLASGYLFAALSVVPWVLTFPGVFAPSGLLDAGLQSTATIAAVRRIGFPAFVLAYAWMSRADDDAEVPPARVSAAILGSLGGVAALVAATTWIAVASEALPQLMLDDTQVAAAWQVVPPIALALCAAALVLLWIRGRSVLDLWLMVALSAVVIEILLLAYLGAGERYSLGWWAGRLYGLISASVVLLVLLSETTTLYARLVRSLAAEQRSRASRLATMEALSASIAHEVNQPVASMVTNAEAGLRWLDRPTPDLEETRAALRRIVGDGHRAATVVAGIRTVFQKNARERRPLEVGALVEEALRKAQTELQANRIAATAEFDERLPAVLGNPVQLHQVLANLIANAVEALGSTGHRPRTLSVAATLHDQSSVLVSVADNGPGLEGEERDRIFEPFFTTRAHGMGMGLLICRSIVEAHGGRLWTDRNQPQGAVFRFTLPTAESEAG